MSKIKKEEKERMVLSYPDLVFREFMCILAITTFFLLLSIFFNAPLEDMARTAETPNPAKAPWYFVGLQELLVYFDPWLGGVVIPMMIIICLMVIPYLHRSKEAAERTFRHRTFGVSIFTFGLIFWFSLIIVGQYLRGPNWMLYWPWESKDVIHRQNPYLWSLSQELGILLIGTYYGLGGVLPGLIKREFFHRMGLIRYTIFMFLALSLLGVVLKILLRLVFQLKYILETPWFNI